MAHFSEAERAAGNKFCLGTPALIEELVLPGLVEADSAVSKPAVKGVACAARPLIVILVFTN
ncbi:hypothetical protein [Paraburkholderia phytofirmans]|uniref:hypothetical protein n=1 Tax=Paraburkholderia phytofirmans TaxID=261302 RepID=UPI0038BD49D5